MDKIYEEKFNEIVKEIKLLSDVLYLCGMDEQYIEFGKGYEESEVYVKSVVDMSVGLVQISFKVLKKDKVIISANYNTESRRMEILTHDEVFTSSLLVGINRALKELIDKYSEFVDLSAIDVDSIECNVESV